MLFWRLSTSHTGQKTTRRIFQTSHPLRTFGVPTTADKILVAWAAEELSKINLYRDNQEITRIIANPAYPSKNLLKYTQSRGLTEARTEPWAGLTIE